MNKQVLITGTTSGIGYALAMQFASLGYDLLLISRNHRKLELQKQMLQDKYGVCVTPIAQDLTKPDAANIVYEQLRAQDLEIEILVNNAGFNEYGEFLTTDITKEKEMIQLHITFMLELTNTIVQDMARRGHGKILNISSAGAFFPCPTDAVYAASKAFLLHFSCALHAELKPRGIQVTIACPGSTDTEFAEKANMQSTLLFRSHVMDATTVAQKSVQALIKGKKVVVIGAYNKFLLTLSKLLPSTLRDRITMRLLKSY